MINDDRLEYISREKLGEYQEGDEVFIRMGKQPDSQYATGLAISAPVNRGRQVQLAFFCDQVLLKKAKMRVTPMKDAVKLDSAGYDTDLERTVRAVILMDEEAFREAVATAAGVIAKMDAEAAGGDE